MYITASYTTPESYSIGYPTQHVQQMGSITTHDGYMLAVFGYVSATISLQRNTTSNDIATTQGDIPNQ